MITYSRRHRPGATVRDCAVVVRGYVSTQLGAMFMGWFNDLTPVVLRSFAPTRSFVLTKIEYTMPVKGQFPIAELLFQQSGPAADAKQVFDDQAGWITEIDVGSQ